MRTSETSPAALFPLLLGGLLPLVGAGCHEGPAERAGKQVDRAARDVRDTVNPPSGPAERAGRQVDRAARDVRDTVNPPSGPAEAAGRKVDDATGRAP